MSPRREAWRERERKCVNVYKRESVNSSVDEKGWIMSFLRGRANAWEKQQINTSKALSGI